MSELLIDYKETKQDIKKRVDIQYAHKTSKKRKLIYNIYYSQPGKWYEGMYNMWKESRKIVGVCCFSESPFVTLMWSHYADSHKGINLGFNIEPFQYGDSTKCLIQSINYLEEIKPVRIGEPNGKAIGHWLFTKSHIWQYEKEVRAVFLRKNGLISFDKKCLKEVLFGCRVTDEEVNRTMELLKINDFHEIKCFKMKIDSSVFDVRPVEIESIN